MSLKIDEAREEGYSNEEILDFLSKQKNYAPQISQALEDGYEPSEIIQFLSEKKPKSLKEHVQRKVGGSLIEAAVKGITAIPNFIDALGQLGIKGTQKLLNKMGLKLSDEQASKAFDIAKAISPTAGIPQGEEIVEQIHEATGGKFRPETSAEEIAQKASGIIGGIAGFGPSNVIGTPLRAAGSIALGTTTAALEKEGINPWIAMGGGILADILTRSIGGASKKILGIASKGVPKALGEATASVTRVKPEEIKQGVIEAAERLGIKPEELPLSAQVGNPIILQIESTLRSSSLSGKALEEQLERTGKKLVEPYELMAKELSSREELLPSVVSEEAMNALQKIEETAEESYRYLYSQAMKQVPEDARVSPQIGKAILSVIEKTMRKLKSDLGTPAKDALYKRLERLKENWSSSEMLEGYIPVQKIIEAKQDLNQVIKYELKGGVDKLLEPLVAVMRKSIQQYGNEFNPKFLNRFNKAEQIFKENARTFRKDPTIRSLVEGKSPERIFSQMNTVKGIRDLGKTFGKSTEGQEAFQALKRYKLEDLIGSKLLNKKGEISWGNASGMFKNPRTRDLVIELVGPQNYKKLKDLITVSSGIEEGLRKFLNTSQTATKHFDIALLVSLPIKAISQLFMGRPIKAALTGSGMLTPRFLANLLTNAKFIEAIKETALAGKGSSQKRFLESAKKAAAIVASEIASQDSKESED